MTRIVALSLAWLFLAPAVAAETRYAPHTHALLINGGQSPPDNALSHLHHLQDMVEALTRRGLSPERIHVFSSDGQDPKKDLVVRGSLDPRLWLIDATPLGKSLGRADLTNTVWDDVTLRPATLAELRAWFVRMGRELAPGDTLLVFVTDHGKRNDDDPGNSHISLWKESLSVLEFRALLGHLQPGTRVVNVMSQCFSGGFAEAMSPFHDPTPTGDVCGFYSTTAERPAYGCYPEGRDKDRIGHAFRFIDAMTRNDTMDAAHLDVLATDLTPDVPLRTSDLYLRRLLREEAGRREIALRDQVDELLDEAWRDRGRWEPEIRLLDRLGSVYGVFSPRSLAELRAHIASLQKLSEELKTYEGRWRLALNDLRRDNLARFFDSNPDWQERVEKKKLDRLAPEDRRQLTKELLTDLENFARQREDVWSRLDELRGMHRESQEAGYRVEVRLAALLRMRMILIRVAARQFLEAAGSDGAHDHEEPAAALEALEACEASRIGALPETEQDVARELETLPPFEQELAVVQRVLPSWLGIRFVMVPDETRDELGLEAGAVVVQQVFEESAAGLAGIRTGDFVIGPPGKPFDEPRRLREWIMRSPRDTPLRLELLREGEPVEAIVSLEPYPTQRPQLPAPPGQGEAAPELPALRVVSGPSGNEPELPEVKGRHLLFFWATWCEPCKRSLPELIAWSEASSAPVLAVSDENPSTVRSFLDRWSEPFPELVLSDELRLSYVSYGVNGTPTFVLIDEAGQIEWRQTGYTFDGGLKLPDWDWRD
jgi:thiol-disulfide isomerase/thioredoxin